MRKNSSRQCQVTGSWTLGGETFACDLQQHSQGGTQRCTVADVHLTAGVDVSSGAPRVWGKASSCRRHVHAS